MSRISMWVMGAFVAAVATGLSPASAPGAERPAGPPAALQAQEREFVAQALAGAKQLVKSLPTTDKLGLDWKRAWELPPSVPQRAASEDEYWQKAVKEMGMAGLSEAQARSAVDQMGTFFAQQGASVGMGEREGVVTMLLQMRGQNAPPHTKMLSGLEMAVRSFQVAAQTRGADGRPDPNKSTKQIMAATLAPFEGMTTQQIKDMFVKESTLIKQRTQMTYFRSNNWEAVNQARSERDIVERGIWIGSVRINCMIVDSGRIAEVADLAKADGPKLQAKLDAALRSVANAAIQSRQQEVNQRLERAQALPNGPDRDYALKEAAKDRDHLAAESAAFGRMAVTVSHREFGENSYVIGITGVSPDTAGLSAGQYSAWIRKGSAMAEITLGGNFPEEQLKKEMDHFLSEMDYAMDLMGGGADLDVGGRAPTVASGTGAGTVTPPGTATPATPGPTTPPPPVNPAGYPLPNPTGTTPVPPVTLPPPTGGTGTVPPPAPPLPPVPTPPIAQGPAELERGNTLAQQGDLKGAVAEYDKALALSPANRPTLLARGTAKLWLNDLKGALADHVAAATADPSDLRTRSVRGVLELCAGDPKVALRESEALVRASPNDASAVLLHAQALMLTGDVLAAGQEFQRVRAIDPNRTQSLYQEADNAARRSVWAVAELQFRSILLMDAKVYQPHFGLAGTLAAQGKRRKAIAEYQEYLKYDSTSDWAKLARQQIAQIERDLAARPAAPANQPGR